jgi:glycine dehydrogenase subunit 2
MNNKLYGNLIFELSKEGRKGYSLPKNNFGSYEIPSAMRRTEDAVLPSATSLLWCAIILICRTTTLV